MGPLDTGMDGPAPLPPDGQLPPHQLSAARTLVNKVEAQFGADGVLGASLDSVRNLATTREEREIIERLLSARPQDLGLATPAVGPIGKASEATLVATPEIGLNNLLATGNLAHLAGEKAIRLTGQRYYSLRRRQDVDMKPVLISTAALDGFVALQRAAISDLGRPLLVLSQHRTRGHQLIVLLRSLVATAGDVDSVLHSTALPGFSEHQDLVHPAFDFADRNGTFGTDFANTPDYKWLQANASRFGFALSYDQNNSSGIIFEPWHWRYVGTDNARLSSERF